MNKNPCLLLLIFLFFVACSSGQVNKNVESTPKIESLLKKQTLLTNNAKFTKKRTLEGASGFLIKYKNSNFAVTARHLLGEAGGVEPEIKLNELSKELLKWEMSPRVVTNAARETVKLNADGLNFSNSTHDILLLNVISETSEFETLIPNFNLPAAGETLYLIGCPYSESNCRQNFYKLKYIEFDDAESLLVFEMSVEVELSGFSGAPVVNGKGEVVGALVSGGKEGGKNYAAATHIKEIQKIK